MLDNSSLPQNDNAASLLDAAVDSIRLAAGAIPREPSALEQLSAAVGAARSEMGRLDSLFDIVCMRLEAGDFTAEHMEALKAWAMADAALFSFTRDFLRQTNDGLAYVVSA